MTHNGGSECSAYRLGTFQIEPSRNLISDGSDRFRVEPRIMDVLCTLAEREGEVVTRSELLDQHWGDQFGGDESLTRAISHLRKTFKIAGAKEPYIETIPKRGYRLKQPVKGLRSQDAKAHAGKAQIEMAGAETAAQEIPLSYSVAVVPLRCSGGSAEHSLAENIGHDLVQMLSRTPHLRVAAYSGCSKDQLDQLGAGELGRLLNVHYLVSGSILSDGDQLTLRIELIDTIANRHILSWKLAEQTARFLANLDSFILDLSTPIVSEIQISEASLAHTRDPDEVDAYAAVCSTEMLRTAYSSQRAREIIDHLDHLIEREPDNAFAHASLAMQLTQNIVSGWSPAPAEDLEKAALHTKHALKIAPLDPDVQAAAGISAFMKREDERALQFLRRSLASNPNNPHTLAVLGFQVGITGDHQAGIEMVRTAEKRAPHHPRYSVWAMYRGNGLLAADRVEEAVEAYWQAIDRNPNYQLPYVLLATAYILLNRFDEARAALAGALEVCPQYSLQNWNMLLIKFPEIYRRRIGIGTAEILERCKETWAAVAPRSQGRHSQAIMFSSGFPRENIRL